MSGLDRFPFTIGIPGVPRLAFAETLGEARAVALYLHERFPMDALITVTDEISQELVLGWWIDSAFPNDPAEIVEPVR